MNWTENRYRIAAYLFEAKLDEAFALGIQESRGNQASQIRVEMEYKKIRALETGLTKAQSVGWDRCMEVVKDAIS